MHIWRTHDKYQIMIANNISSLLNENKKTKKDIFPLPNQITLTLSKLNKNWKCIYKLHMVKTLCLSVLLSFVRYSSWKFSVLCWSALICVHAEKIYIFISRFSEVFYRYTYLFDIFRDFLINYKFLKSC